MTIDKSTSNQKRIAQMNNKRLIALMTNRDNQLIVVIGRNNGKYRIHTYNPTNASRARLDLWIYGKTNHIVLESGGPVVYISH